MTVLVTEKNFLKANYFSDEEDTQHALKARSKLEKEDTLSEDIGGIGTSRSEKLVQVEHDELQQCVEKKNESLMALVTYVDGEKLRRREKVKKNHEALKAKGDHFESLISFCCSKLDNFKAPTPAAEVDVPRPTAQIEKPINAIHVPTAKVESKDVPTQIDEYVVPTGEAEKAKDEPAKVVENASPPGLLLGPELIRYLFAIFAAISGCVSRNLK
ncbi:hypothetical protein K7X08_010566 [Anisodus acutangulus]|uniref:Uncharacterized protein n=1 Tax=Anisodus acutangulus TaxID=402998 RepID=A0A9Q1RRU9_9SOLA|nr:hypothetical protein K7X08_010566 [Anisodus acutangulus]